MEDKSYIIIDDEDQRLRMDSLIDRKIRNDGFVAKSFYVNPIDRDYWGDDKDIDFTKVIESIQDMVKTHHINIIACDYQYNGSNFSGMDMVLALRKAEFQCPIILYSGNEATVAKSILGSNLDTDEKKVTHLESLLKAKISRFFARGSYPDFILEHLKKNYGIKDIVVKKLEEYPNTTIKYDLDFFEGKTFAEVIKEINKDTLQGHRFLANILELAIARYAEVNE